MRGIQGSKEKLRTQVFTEIAKLAFEGWDVDKFRNLPYKIIPGVTAHYRDSVFVERKIVGERLRAAMGLSLRDFEKYEPNSSGIEPSLIADKYYEPPLIDVIKFACNSCPDRVVVTDGCQHCLEHPCTAVCRKDAIHIVDGKTVIDQDKCVKCGMCQDACPYGAIIKQERPCAKVCGMNAFKKDEYGRAQIDYDKCVSCGQCLVNCPFGAIIDKSQIYQVVTAIKSDTPLYAITAPALIGQFGPTVTGGQLRRAFKEVGFTDVFEVAVGADLCAIDEAKDFLKKVPAEQPFMATSCCPAWSVMAKKLYPQYKEYISMALTPMVLTARMVKKEHPDCKIVFVGPCAAKKLEASRRSIRSDVDFVLTFEEFGAILDAKNIVVSECEEDEQFGDATTDGIRFAVSGGVAKAVENVIHKMDPDRVVLTMKAETLPECRKMLAMAKAGKYNGYLLEGMACPGGCVGGAGVIINPKTSAKAVNDASLLAPHQNSDETEFIRYLDMVVDEEEDY